MNNLFLFIIWENGRVRQKQVLASLKARFEVIKIYDIHWSPSLVMTNFERLMQRRITKRHVSKIGDGNFLLIIIRDKYPKYKANIKGNTSNGQINMRISETEKMLRHIVKNKDCIYATQSNHETNRKLSLLMGVNIVDFMYSIQPSDQIEYIERDLVGAVGWENIEQFFYILNNTLDYVVLRNWECLPDDFTIEGHGDIDILVRNEKDALWVTGAQKMSSYKDDAAFLIKIGGMNIPFDIRRVGDNYYDKNWEICMLECRKLNKNSIYVQDDVNYFYSLLYHALIQKNEITADYKGRLQLLAGNIDVNINSLKVLQLLELLDKFMCMFHYKYVRPNNIYATFNEANIQQSEYAKKYGVAKSLRYRWNYHIRPIKVITYRIIKLLSRLVNI